MRRVMMSLIAAVGLGVSVAAQAPPPTPGFELRSFAGAYQPTGAQRTDFKAAEIFGAQIAREFSDNVHLLGSVGWAHSHNKYATINNDLTYIWQYDAGIEFNLVQDIGNGWLFRPLVGFGAGARTYDYRAGGVASNTCSTGYGSVGSEFQRGSVALRLEARDYVYCFKSPITAVKRTSNDIGLTFGLAYHIR